MYYFYTTHVICTCGTFCSVCSLLVLINAVYLDINVFLTILSFQVCMLGDI